MVWAIPSYWLLCKASAARPSQPLHCCRRGKGHSGRPIPRCDGPGTRVAVLCWNGKCCERTGMGYESGRGFLVTVVDDDQSMRESLPDLLRECGYEVETFSSAEVFLASGDLDRTKCLVLDVAMPGMSGPELHRELHRRGRSMPVVFITAHGDDTMRPRL